MQCHEKSYETETGKKGGRRFAFLVSFQVPSQGTHFET
jgi:hypothetical protein